jgi:hypothetical protein
MQKGEIFTLTLLSPIELEKNMITIFQCKEWLRVLQQQCRILQHLLSHTIQVIFTDFHALKNYIF